MKPGLLTSEFLLALLHKVLAVLVAVGFFTTQAAGSIEANVGTIVTASASIIALVTSAWVSNTYTNARTSLKAPTPEKP